MGKGPEQILLQRGHTEDTQTYEKRCSRSLAIREMHVETTMRHHLIPVGAATISKPTNECWGGCGERGTLVHCGWECRLGQPLWETVWRFLKILKIELSCDPASSPLVIIQRQQKH